MSPSRYDARRARRIGEHLGFPLRDFLAALRIERGIEGIVGGHDVIRAQTEAGHESASSFTRSFARHTGLAPLRYRDQLRFLAAYLTRHMASRWLSLRAQRAAVGSPAEGLGGCCLG